MNDVEANAVSINITRQGLQPWASPPSDYEWKVTKDVLKPLILLLVRKLCDYAQRQPHDTNFLESNWMNITLLTLSPVMRRKGAVMEGKQKRKRWLSLVHQRLLTQMPSTYADSYDIIHLEIQGVVP